MPAKSSTIDLLGEQDLSHTPVGRIITWATTYGRYIMITTEIVVLLAFVSRFSLDRKITDLNEEIDQMQLVIEANSDFEGEIRDIQKKVERIKKLIDLQETPVRVLQQLQTYLPPDVYFESLSYSEESLKIKATAGTTLGFSQFLANVTSARNITAVEIGEIKKNPITGIQFQLNAKATKP